MISTAQADYRSDLDLSLVVNFHDILTNIRIKRLLKIILQSLFILQGVILLFFFDRLLLNYSHLAKPTV
ncbi:hypothetical protein AT681_03585 [Limosilactobacillus reuteri]|nr:hypothetical protein [Limosilactobacillus reuteri]